MFSLAEKHLELAARTSDFLLAVLNGAVTAARVAAEQRRHLEPPEQQRVRDGLCAAAMAMDVVKSEHRCAKLNQPFAFTAKMAEGLRISSDQLAQHTRALEGLGDQFLLDYQRRLGERLEKYFGAKRGTKRRNDNGRDDDDAENIRLTGQPTPEQGYKALAMLDGRYGQWQNTARENARRKRHAQSLAQEPAWPDNAADAPKQPAALQDELEAAKRKQFNWDFAEKDDPDEDDFDSESETEDLRVFPTRPHTPDPNYVPDLQAVNEADKKWSEAMIHWAEDPGARERPRVPDVLRQFVLNKPDIDNYTLWLMQQDE